MRGVEDDHGHTSCRPPHSRSNPHSFLRLVFPNSSGCLGLGGTGTSLGPPALDAELIYLQHWCTNTGLSRSASRDSFILSSQATSSSMEDPGHMRVTWQAPVKTYTDLPDLKSLTSNLTPPCPPWQRPHF